MVIPTSVSCLSLGLMFGLFFADRSVVDVLKNIYFNF